MSTGRRPPDDPLGFIQRCLRERKLHWTYHVNMRLAGRHISRDEILGAVDGYSVVEAYPEDKELAELPAPGYVSGCPLPRPVRRRCRRRQRQGGDGVSSKRRRNGNQT